jgi:hypothetical protein
MDSWIKKVLGVFAELSQVEPEGNEYAVLIVKAVWLVLYAPVKETDFCNEKYISILLVMLKRMNGYDTQKLSSYVAEEMKCAIACLEVLVMRIKDPRLVQQQLAIHRRRSRSFIQSKLYEEMVQWFERNGFVDEEGFLVF